MGCTPMIYNVSELTVLTEHYYIFLVEPERQLYTDELKNALRQKKPSGENQEGDSGLTLAHGNGTNNRGHEVTDTHRDLKGAVIDLRMCKPSLFQME